MMNLASFKYSPLNCRRLCIEADLLHTNKLQGPGWLNNRSNFNNLSLHPRRQLLIPEFSINYQESPLEVTLLPHAMDGNFRAPLPLKRLRINSVGVDVLGKYESQLESNYIFPCHGTQCSQIFWHMRLKVLMKIMENWEEIRLFHLKSHIHYWCLHTRWDPRTPEVC